MERASRPKQFELAAETLQLARVREIKNHRFKHALRLAFAFYAWSVAVFLILRNR
jgi:hypothetical protein